MSAATLERVGTHEDTARDDVGTGPFRLTGTPAPSTEEAAPAATDQPDTTPEAAMIDSDVSTTPTAAAPPASKADGRSGWPSSDRPQAAAPSAPERPPIRVDGDTRPARRDNPLVAGLVKAMREAAVASRAETTARLQAEASARVEAIRARATDETAALRKRADEDVTEIRDWSKLELARIRQVTEDRIEARKAELTGEIDRHAASVEHLVEQVQATVAAFESDMDSFFEQLLAENDPAKLAGLAERAPEPPDLLGEAPSAMDDAEAAVAPGVDHTWDMPAVPATEPVAEAGAVEPVAADPAPEAPTPEDQAGAPTEPEAPAVLEADAAAEAEAEASEGLDPNALDAWPTVAPAAQLPQPTAAPADANGPDSTRLFVNGLTSVAQISSFKGGLSALRGVRSVSVSSGERGVFVFTVSHDPGVDLDSGVAGLPAFAARITDATDDGFTVAVDGASR